MPVDEAEALRKQYIKSICWGLGAVAIGGGLRLSPYRDRFPDILFMGMGLVSALLGFLSLHAHRTGTERAYRCLATFSLIILGIGVFLGAVFAAWLISLSIVLLLGINNRLIDIIAAVVLVALWGLVAISYFWHRASNPTEPTPTFLGHASWSVFIALFGSVAAIAALMFGFASIVFVRHMNEGASAEHVAIFAIMSVLPTCLFVFAISCLREFWKKKPKAGPAWLSVAK